MNFTLPIVPPPRDDETLTSWMSRIAAANLMPLTWVMKAAGWTSSTHYSDTVTGYGIVLAPQHADGLSRVTGVPPERLHTMVPTNWIGTLARGTDRRGNDIALDARRFAANNWLYSSGSHYCPQCLEDNDGAWQLTWKSPYTFACPTHHSLLRSHCPQCQHRADHGRLDGSARPAFPKAIPQPGRCHNPRKQEGTKQERGACLHNLATDTPGPDAPPSYLAAQHDAYAANQTFEQWNDLRALTAYTLTVHPIEAVEHLLEQNLPEELRAAWVANYETSRQRLAENRRQREESGIDWRTFSQDTTGRKPPTNTLLLATAVTLAHRAQQDDDVFAEFIQIANDTTHPTPGSRFTNLRASTHLIERARDAHIGERKTLLHSGLDSRYATPARQGVQFNAEHLPPYLWNDLYDKHLAQIFEPVAVTRRTARKFAIIALYRSATGTTWTTATSRFLDGAITSPRTAYAVLHNLKNSTQGDLKNAALLAITAISAELTHDIVDTHYATRLWADHRFRRAVPYDAYRAATSDSDGHLTTPTRRLNAAVWLWSHHTLADRIDAPTWKGVPTDSQLERYRVWCATTDENTKSALLRWAALDRPSLAS